MNKKSNSGFTLVEMLICIVIIVIVIVVVSSAYLLSQRAYRVGGIMVEITQNGRVILDRMTREIRQAKEIVTELPDEKTDSSSGIIFHDGHLSLVLEEGEIDGAGEDFAIFKGDVSDIDDFYKDMFIQILDGPAGGQVRKIEHYDGFFKKAVLENEWNIIPPGGSRYKIDTSYYYISYYKDDLGNVWREVFSYYFSGNPEISVPWNAIPPEGQIIESRILEEPRVVGEYVSEMNFWRSGGINIFLVLEKIGQRAMLSTKIFGRNL